jgi:hypothetical protein
MAFGKPKPKTSDGPGQGDAFLLLPGVALAGLVSLGDCFLTINIVLRLGEASIILTLAGGISLALLFEPDFDLRSASEQIAVIVGSAFNGWVMFVDPSLRSATRRFVGHSSSSYGGENNNITNSDWQNGLKWRGSAVSKY